VEVKKKAVAAKKNVTTKAKAVEKQIKAAIPKGK